MNAITTPGSAEDRGWEEHPAGTILRAGSLRDVSASPDFDEAGTLDFLASAIRQARLAAVGEERTRLARELHDTLIQTFTGITLQLQALRRRILESPHEAEQCMGRVLEVADLALCDARLTIWEMRNPELERSDIATTLEESARDAIASYQIAGGVPVDFELIITGERRRLSPEVEAAAYRIGREAVANAVTHAHARNIRIAIAFEIDHLCIEVHDDGVGFEVTLLNPREGGGHWGLVGMRERARNANGTFDVRSAPRAGSRA